MLYRAYKEKLERRTRTFERVWRFRLLFLAGLLLLLAASIALMSVAGDVSAEAVAETVSYGEPLAASVHTVLGREGGFEYRPAGTETWSDEAPTAAGEYECRSYGLSVVGTRKYGSVFSYRILPVAADIRVKTDTLIYGETPEFTAPLRYDDVLHVGKYTLEENGGRLDVSADLDFVSVTNAAGEDVTASYILTQTTRSVADAPRPVTVRTPSAAFEYDGAPHADGAAEFGGYGLAEGHTAEVTCASATEAGRYENAVLGLHIFDGNGEEVTDRYAVSYETGTLEISRRRISVKTGSDSFVYDGTAHAYAEYELTGSLAAGEEISLSRTLSVLDVGEYPNAPRVSVFYGGEDKTQNYEIAEDFGTISVLPRPVTVRTGSQTRVYDATARAYEEFTVDYAQAEKLDGHEVSVRFSVSADMANAGTHPNVCTASVLADGRDVTRNYEIAYSFGNVTVSPRLVRVETGSESFVYDGAAHTCTDFTVLPADGEGYDVVFGHRLVAAAVARITECGDAENELRFTAESLSPRRDVTQNYEIVCVRKGKLTVTQRGVTLRAGDAAAVYDGQPHSAETWREEAGSLVRGHRVTATYDAYVDAGTYSNVPKSPRIVDAEGRDVTANYAPVWEEGQIRIAEREVALLTASDRWTYDGQPHSKADYTETGSARLVAGHRVEASYPSITDAGEAENRTFGTILVRDGQGADVTKNYKITWSYGRLVVTQRSVTVTSKALTAVYDDKPHSEAGYVAEGLVQGHAFSADVTAPQFTEAGQGENVLAYSSVRITDGAGGNVAGNYTVQYKNGAVNIERRPITVRTGSGSWVYDGKGHSFEQFDVVYPADGKLAGHEVRVNYLPSEAAAGTYENRCEAFVERGGSDVTGNYRISYENGSVTITVRPVLVRTGSETFPYDDRWHENGSFDVLTEEGYYPLAEGQSLAVVGSTRIRDCGEATNVATFRVTAGGEDVTKNYAIEQRGGKLEVTPKKLVLLSASQNFEYDGQPHGAPRSDATDGTSLLSGHSVAADYPSFTDAETYRNIPSAVRILRESGEAVAEGNYTIEWKYGNVTVLRRQVSLLTDSAEWTYDGQPHDARSFTPIKNTLVGGHRVEAPYPARTDAGESPNSFAEGTARIFDGNGNEVTQNYEITWSYGTLKCNVRPVTVTADDGEWVYDATEKSKPTYGACENLVAGHVFTADVRSFTKRTAAGEEKNILELDWDILAGGVSVKGNYSLEVLPGTLRITQRPFRYLSSPHTWVYDGESHTDETFTFEGLLPSHTVHSFRVVSNTSVQEVTGGFPNLLTVEFVLHDGEGADVTENYEIKAGTPGSLKVTARPITVRTKDGGWLYDGVAHTCEDFETVYGEYPQIPGHEVQPKFRSFKDATTYQNTCEAKIYAAGKDVTNNYEIKYEFGRVVVTKRPLRIESGSATWVYDGLGHSTTSFTAEEPSEGRGLAAPDTIVAVSGITVTDITDTEEGIGYAENRILSIVIRDADRQIINQNYEIEETYGKLRIKSPIVIRLFSLSKPYDGTPLEYEANDYVLLRKPVDVETEWIRVRLGGSITQAGALSLAEVRRLCSGTVENGGDDLTAQNRFDFEGSDTPLKVTPRVIRVTSISISRERGEEPLLGTDTGGVERELYWVSYGSLLDGHELRCTVTGVLLPEEDSAENTLADVKVYDAYGNDMTGNYEITLKLGTLAWLDES